MKKILIIKMSLFFFFLVTLSIYSSEGNGFVLSSEEIYSCSYLVVKNDAILLFANIKENQSGSLPVKIVLGSNGELVSATKVAREHYYNVGVKKLTGGEHIYFASTTLDGSQAVANLTKTSENGDVVWSKIYPYPNNDYYLDDVVETNDKGFMILFWLIDINPVLVLMKIDENGNVQWEKSYKNINIYSFCQASDGGYFLSSAPFNSTSVLLKLDMFGNILWKKTLKSGKELFIGGMTSYGENTLISCKIKDDKLTHAAGILEIDSQGNILKKVGFTNSFSGSGRAEIKKLGDNELILIDTVKINDDDFDIWLINLDNQLNVRWEKRFGYSYWDEIYDIEKNSNGEYYLVGYYDYDYPEGNFNPLIMKLNSSGSLGFVCPFEKSISSTSCSFSLNVIDEIVPSTEELAYFSNDIDFTLGENVDFTFFPLCSPECPTISILPESLPSGKSGEPYSVALSATGGNAPYKFSVSSGRLPSGLSLSEGGVLSGTPEEGGDFSFTVSAVDSSYCTGTKDYTLHIEITPPSITSVSKLSDPFRLKVTGSNFHSDLKVYIEGELWTNIKYKSSSQVVLKGGTALKQKFPKGVAVEIKIVNGDVGEARYTYKR